MIVTLYRPLGLHELALIFDSDCRAFPARLPHQPIFYPVANAEYAHQIARDWNTPDEASGYCGFVTRFNITKAYLERFEPKTVGSSMHVEYWIPAEMLEEFNRSMVDGIHVLAGYFGTRFIGHVPVDGELAGKNAAQQLVAISDARAHGSNELHSLMAPNRKAVFLNYLYWQQGDFVAAQISPQQQMELLAELRAAWDSQHAGFSLPSNVK